MVCRRVLPVVFTCVFLSAAPSGEAQAEGDVLLLTGKRYQVAFSRENGSIERLSQNGRAGSIFSSGEPGLWQARLLDGRRIDAASFSATSAKRSFRCTGDGSGAVLRMTYDGPEIAVAITVTSQADGVDFVAEVTPRRDVVGEFALPAQVRFRPEDLDRLVCPSDGNQSVGTAFLPTFFEPQARPTSWKPRVVGSKGYESLFGGPPVMRPDRDPPVGIRLTDEGRTWLGELSALPTKATVNRPPKAGQADLVLVDSVHGPYFSARRLGEGRLWRIGGNVQASEERLATSLVTRVMKRLAASRPEGRDKVGLVALRYGPIHGSWTSVSVTRWSQQLRGLPLVASGKLQLVEFGSVEEIAKAQDSRDFLAIFNPYGEWLPVAKTGDMETAVAAVGRYVRRGGNWFEVGGHAFFCELLPAGHFYEYAASYPPAFADFFHFQTHVGTAAVYRVQPRDWAPWAGLKDKRAIFVPGRIACGGDEKGGWCDRPFVTYVTPGSTWRCPDVRLTVGNSAIDDLRTYARANGIQRRLEDKMRPELLEKLKRSVLLYYAGTADEKLRYLDLLPVPCQIHFADYLHGGFDKQYPDHLPPSPRFGTPQQFREFIDAAHRRGHLVMPYTNPTWWCDEPKGPTFQKAGEGPLLKLLDGKRSAERYAENTGFTVCHWHTAVQDANRRTLRQFREEYPVDILFQDQCGARGWRYDLNEASPTPYAYVEALLSMIDEDSRQVPLSTESGWDRVVNAESQLCGMTWSIVPTKWVPPWRQLMNDRYAPNTWEVFPLAQHLAHDKTAMLHHDLGQFVTNRQVLAWTLGLGFSMSFKLPASALRDDAALQWLLWLDRIQKSVCSRYVGQPLEDFRHDRGPHPTCEDDGTLRAKYRNGSLCVVANLGPRPRQEAGHRLPGYGFLVTAPDLLAANLSQGGERALGEEGISFVAEGDGRKIEVWIYSPAGQDALLVLPVSISKPLRLLLDDGSLVQTVVRDDGHHLRLPSRPRGMRQSATDAGRIKYLWHGSTKIE